VRVLDIADNHADGVGAAGVHGARHLVGPVAQRRRRLVDPRLDLFTDGAVTAKRPGRLRFRYAGRPGDVGDGGRFNACFLVGHN